MAQKILTQEYLHSLFEYRDGILYSKINRYKTTTKKGSVIGYPCESGYLRTGLNYKTYKIHRLIFIMFHGYSPKEIDHINGIKTDNRIENLREVTTSQNQCNKSISKRNTTGIKNVTKECSKWRVRISVNKKMINIGFFDDIELAELVAQEARNKYHGEFARD